MQRPSAVLSVVAELVSGLASKGKGKRKQVWLQVGETLRKHWEFVQFGGDLDLCSKLAA